MEALQNKGFLGLWKFIPKYTGHPGSPSDSAHQEAAAAQLPGMECGLFRVLWCLKTASVHDTSADFRWTRQTPGVGAVLPLRRTKTTPGPPPPQWPPSARSYYCKKGATPPLRRSTWQSSCHPWLPGMPPGETLHPAAAP